MRLFLAFVTVIGFGAVVGAVVVGLQVLEGTVVEKPYEQGLSWDERQRERIQSGFDVSLEGEKFRTGDNLVVARVTRNGVPAPGEEVELLMRRPGSGEHTNRYRLSGRGDGTYDAAAVLPLPGRWEAVITVQHEGRPVEFRHVTQVAGAVREENPGAGEVPCDIDTGPCTAVLSGGGAVSLEITPRPVRTMKDLFFTLRFDGQSDPETEEIFLHLDMPGMYMGEIRVRLLLTEERVYGGPGIIVRCPSGRRTWRATVGEEGPGSAVFSLQVDRP